jgi:hypothetical protein
MVERVCKARARLRGCRLTRQRRSANSSACNRGIVRILGATRRSTPAVGIVTAVANLRGESLGAKLGEDTCLPDDRDLTRFSSNINRLE